MKTLFRIINTIFNPNFANPQLKQIIGSVNVILVMILACTVFYTILTEPLWFRKLQGTDYQTNLTKKLANAKIDSIKLNADNSSLDKLIGDQEDTVNYLCSYFYCGKYKIVIGTRSVNSVPYHSKGISDTIIVVFDYEGELALFKFVGYVDLKNYDILSRPETSRFILDKFKKKEYHIKMVFSTTKPSVHVQGEKVKQILYVIDRKFTDVKTISAITDSFRIINRYPDYNTKPLFTIDIVTEIDGSLFDHKSRPMTQDQLNSFLRIATICMKNATDLSE